MGIGVHHSMKGKAGGQLNAIIRGKCILITTGHAQRATTQTFHSEMNAINAQHHAQVVLGEGEEVASALKIGDKTPNHEETVNTNALVDIKRIQEIVTVTLEAQDVDNEEGGREPPVMMAVQEGEEVRIPPMVNSNAAKHLNPMTNAKDHQGTEYRKETNAQNLRNFVRQKANVQDTPIIKVQKRFNLVVIELMIGMSESNGCRITLFECD